jgi:hypothetical protein
LSSHIVEKGLEAVIPADSMDTIEIARRAEAEADRICASLGISPYGTPDLTKIGLYDIIVFCDDSESMLKGNRFDDQKSIVQRISRIAQTYNRSGISLRFINFQDDEGYNHLNHGEINSVISNVFPEGSTKLGTKLLEKVLFPFVLNPAKRMELRKPVLISIITDGEVSCAAMSCGSVSNLSLQPTEEDIDTLKYTILATKRELGKFVNARGLPYGRSAVTFQINRIGDSPDSKRYLERLSSDPELSSLIFCNDETLDAAVREAGPDSGALNTWVYFPLLTYLIGRKLTAVVDPVTGGCGKSVGPGAWSQCKHCLDSNPTAPESRFPAYIYCRGYHGNWRTVTADVGSSAAFFYIGIYLFSFVDGFGLAFGYLALLGELSYL